jgi:hypothetical protein
LELKLSSGVRFESDKHPREVAAMPAVESTWFRVDRSQAPYFVALKSPDSKYEYYFAELLMCAHLVTATSSDEVGRGHTPGVCMGRPSQGSASTPPPTRAGDRRSLSGDRSAARG